MRRRRVIGRFKRSKQGGWEGEIDTLTIHKRRIRLVPNDNRVSDDAPAFRVMLGWNPIGDAWEKKSHSDPPRYYLRLEIDDPFAPMIAVLFPDADGLTAQLLWGGEPSTFRQRFRPPVASVSGPATPEQSGPTSSSPHVSPACSSSDHNSWS
jgi:uncharacterized protein (DUF736 family)